MLFRKKKGKWLIVPVEVKHREMHSRLLLSLKAVNEGCNVIFGREGQIRYRIKLLPKGIYFAKQLSKEAYKWHSKNTLNSGFIIVSNDEEGLASVGNEYFYVNQRHSQEMLDNTRLFFAWGNAEFNVINRSFDRTENKIIPVGNPRVDLWKSNIKNIYRSKINEYKQRFGAYILMPSSFSMSRHKLGDEFVYNEYLRKGLLNTDEGKLEFNRLKEFKTNTMHKFEHLVIQVANDGSRTIVFRPHPSEDIQKWEEVFSNYSNIKVINEGEVTPWILGSELIIHSFCTTGLEAFLMKRPVISYKPLDSHPYSEFISNKIGFVATTEKEALDFVNKIEKKKISYHKSWRAGIECLNEYINCIDERDFAHSRMIEELLKIETWEEVYFENIKAFNFKILKRILKSCLPFSKAVINKSRADDYIFSGLTKKELINVIHKLVEHTDLEIPKVIKKIDDDIYIMCN